MNSPRGRCCSWAVLSVVLLSLLAAHPSTAGAVTLTVGPSGTYPSISLALAQVVSGQDTEIRVQGHNTYFENLVIPPGFGSGSLLLWGGWDSTFTSHNDEPGDTVIDGEGDRVLDILLSGGSFELRNLTVFDGSATQGGGIFVQPGGSASVTIDNCLVLENTATSSGDALGGGLWAVLDDSDHLSITSTGFGQNRSISTGGGQAVAGGLGIVASGFATFLIRGVDLEGNSAATTSIAPTTGGIFLDLSGTAQGDLEDTFGMANTADSNGPIGSAAWFQTTDFTDLQVHQTGWAGNGGINGSTGPQLRSSSAGFATMTITDSGFAQGDQDGIAIETTADSTVYLVNLTVADHPFVGVALDQSGASVQTLYNTIAFGNGTSDLVTTGSVASGSNLIGIDPLFSNPGGLDYRLRAGSPGIDTGDNSPPGGLWSFDLDGNPRVINGIVDIGCYEGPAVVIFADDFESGDLEEWSSRVE